VRGLTKDDFEIYENGVKQPITNFAEYSGDTPHPDPLPAARGEGVSVPQKRTIILFVERFYLPQFRGDPLFASLRKLLHDAVRPGDRAMIVTWNRGILLTQQDFTESLPALDRALDRVAKLSSRPYIDPTDETAWNIADIRAFDAQAASNAGVASDSGVGLADLELEHITEKDAKQMKRKITTIKALMRSIAGAEGKKILLLATRRLSLEAGADQYYRTGSLNVSAEMRVRLDMREELKALEATANGNNITIYPVYPEGLHPGVVTADYLILNNETPALRHIADATGGATAWGSDDVAGLMPRIEEDLETYYSLAYRVQGTGADKGRSIEVRTKDRKLRVRARHQYVEKSDVTKMEDRVIAALFNNPPSPGFALNVQVGKRRPRGNGFVVPIAVHIPVSVLTALPSGSEYTGAFSVYFAWGGMVGGVSETTHDTKSFRIPAAELAKARQNHFTYEFELAANNATERVALGVLDEVSKEYALRLIRLRR